MRPAHRRSIFQSHLFLVAFVASCATVAAQPLPDEVLRFILKDGKWDQTADESMQLRERLDMKTVRMLVDSYPLDTRSIGLLSLTTSAGKWGVTPVGDLPRDPAGAAWKGPSAGTGKHLMNYKTGGVGLPHLDVGALKAFIVFIVASHPEIGSSNEKSHFLSLGGSTFASVRNDPIFRKWMLAALRMEDGQRWIIEYWLDNYWEPALKASNGDVRLALVLARIWNTSSSSGKCSAKRARVSTDPVKAALDAYGTKPCGNPDYKDRRLGYMMRPVSLYDNLHKRTSGVR